MSPSIDYVLDEDDYSPRTDQSTHQAQPEKWWHVSDNAIEAIVRRMSASSDGSSAANVSQSRPPSSASSSVMSRASGLARSQSTSSSSSSQRRASGGRIDIKVIVRGLTLSVGRAETLAIRISPDATIGPVRSLSLGSDDGLLPTSAADATLMGSSLMERIERATHIPPSRQRLFLQDKDISLQSGETLRSLAISHGQVLQMVCARELTRGLGGTPVQGQSAAPVVAPPRSAEGKMWNRMTRDGSLPPRPRWVCQEKPRYFAAVGSGLDSHGGMVKSAEKFSNVPIYRSDIGNPAMDRVRAMPCFQSEHRGRRGGA